MKNKKKLIVTVLQFVLILFFILSYKSYVDFSLKPVQILGYASDISNGTKLTIKDLVSIEVSESTYTNNMITVDRAQEVIGKYTTMDVVQGSIVYTAQLGDITDVDKFESIDLSDKRVITIPISYANGVVGDFQRGDFVDLMYSTSASAEANTSGEEESVAFTYAKIFMQAVPVYQVNTSTGFKFTGHNHLSANQTDENGNAVSGNYEALASVSLIVTPEQAEEIEVRKLTGNLQIVKRFDDSQTHDTLGYVIGEYGKIFTGNASAETGQINVSDSFIVNQNSVTGGNTTIESSKVSTSTSSVE